MTEPGLKTRSLAFAVSEDDNRQLTKIRTHLESTTGKRHSFAKVIRLALDCLGEKLGLEK